jgi:hypothetical protein
MTDDFDPASPFLFDYPDSASATAARAELHRINEELRIERLGQCRAILSPFCGAYPACPCADGAVSERDVPSGPDTVSLRLVGVRDGRHDDAGPLLDGR